MSSSSVPVIIADGDINLDKQVNAADILLAQRSLLNHIVLTAEQVAHGDFKPDPSGDSQLTLADMIFLLKAILVLP